MIEIIGKNGSGKTYLANELYKRGFVRNVGYTTRPMRIGEKNGIDYYFISERQFELLLQNDEFIDYKTKNGSYYGIRKDNFQDNTILVSGDSEIIEKATGLRVYKFYIDSDISTRYARVKNRQGTSLDLFDRFHSENFSFLSDFYAIFINNNQTNSNSLNNMLSYLGSSNNELINKFQNNREFIQNKINDFDLSQLGQCNDILLLILTYEEYVMRKLFLHNGSDLNYLEDNETKKAYYDTMLTFLKSIKANFALLNDSFCVKIDGDDYDLGYRIKRKVKK